MPVKFDEERDPPLMTTIDFIENVMQYCGKEQVVDLMKEEESERRIKRSTKTMHQLTSWLYGK